MYEYYFQYCLTEKIPRETDGEKLQDDTALEDGVVVSSQDYFCYLGRLGLDEVDRLRQQIARFVQNDPYLSCTETDSFFELEIMYCVVSFDGIRLDLDYQPFLNEVYAANQRFTDEYLFHRDEILADAASPYRILAAVHEMADIIRTTRPQRKMPVCGATQSDKPTSEAVRSEEPGIKELTLGVAKPEESTSEEPVDNMPQTEGPACDVTQPSERGSFSDSVALQADTPSPPRPGAPKKPRKKRGPSLFTKWVLECKDEGKTPLQTCEKWNEFPAVERKAMRPKNPQKFSLEIPSERKKATDLIKKTIKRAEKSD